MRTKILVAFAVVTLIVCVSAMALAGNGNDAIDYNRNIVQTITSYGSEATPTVNGAVIQIDDFPHIKGIMHTAITIASNTLGASYKVMGSLDGTTFFYIPGVDSIRGDPDTNNGTYFHQSDKIKGIPYLRFSVVSAADDTVTATVTTRLK